jgi:hypothetical protein
VSAIWARAVSRPQFLMIHQRGVAALVVFLARQKSHIFAMSDFFRIFAADFKSYHHEE